LYAWPGVMPGYEEGYVHKLGCANFLKQKTTPFLLNTDDAKICVEGAMNFKALFDFNMQFALIKQDFIHSLKSYGPFYQSPYPDYYAMNALFLKANRILILPQPMVAIGISPKSYGNYICNQRENEGKAILNNDMEYANITGLEKIILPGTDIHTGWLLAMLTLEKNYGIEFNLQVDRKRYRLLQIVHILVKTGLLGYKQLLPLMSTREWFIYCPMITAMFFLKVLYRKKYNDYLELILDSIRTYPLHNPVRIDGKYKNMVEVCSEDPELLASAMSGHK